MAGDSIDKLPTDATSSPSKSDMNIIFNLFKNKDADENVEVSGVSGVKSGYEFKGSVSGGILFLILSSPMVDNIIRYSGIQNVFYIWGIKFLLFVIIFYIMNKRA